MIRSRSIFMILTLGLLFLLGPAAFAQDKGQTKEKDKSVQDKDKANPDKKSPDKAAPDRKSPP